MAIQNLAQAPPNLDGIWQLWFLLIALVVIAVLFAIVVAIPLVVLAFFGFDPLGIKQLIGGMGG